MTTGNEPTDAGANAPGPDANNDATSIVERPDLSPNDDNADATTISQLPVTPAPAQPTELNKPLPATEINQPLPQQNAQTTQYTAPGAPAAPAPGFQPPSAGQPQYGQAQYGQQPAYGQAPGYGQAPQYGNPAQPQYGAPAAPQYGAPGQAPQQAAPAQPGFGQPQYGASAQPQGGAPQYGAPAYGATGQPQYGAPAYPGGVDLNATLDPKAPNPAAPGAKGGKGKLIAAIVGGLVVVAAIVLLTAFVWPKWAQGGLSQSAVQDGVQKILTQPEPDGYGISDVKDVSCPDGQKVESGTTFTCSVKVNGENKHVTVTVKDSDGTYEVSRPVN